MPLQGKWPLLFGGGGAIVLPLLDDFERADGSLGANWTGAGVDTEVEISGGDVVQKGTTGGDGAYWSSGPLASTAVKGVGAKLAAWTVNTGDELRLFLTVGALGGAGGGGGTNGYRVRFDRAATNDNVIISRQDNGTGTDLNSGTITGHFAAGDVLDVLYTPATGAISVRRNGVEVLAATDSTYNPDTLGFALDGGDPGSPTIEEMYSSTIATRGRIGFAELEAPFVATRGRISFAEFEAPLAPTRGRVSFTELETPFVPTRGRVSFAEVETPLAPTRGRVAWAELEVPLVPTRGRVSWAEFSAPDTAAATPTRGLVSFAELEVPTTPTRGRISFAEVEVPLAPTRGRISFAELEVPTTLTRGRVSWAELQTDLAPTRGRISWAEFAIEDAPAPVPFRGVHAVVRSVTRLPQRNPTRIPY